mmetsp:Transcript_5688/g.13444  ORF Transcript_5688/g.13444 Transcript_5688/m.13444 type:complete len:322 (+) Transcript_5688:577-1542(+)
MALRSSPIPRASEPLHIQRYRDLPMKARIQRFSKQQRMHARLTQTAQLLRSCGPSVWTKTLNSETGVKPGLTRSMLPTVGGSYTSFTSATPAQTSACTIQRSSTGMRRIATRTSTTTRQHRCVAAGRPTSPVALARVSTSQFLQRQTRRRIARLTASPVKSRSPSEDAAPTGRVNANMVRVLNWTPQSLEQAQRIVGRRSYQQRHRLQRLRPPRRQRQPQRRRLRRPQQPPSQRQQSPRPARQQLQARPPPQQQPPRRLPQQRAQAHQQQRRLPLQQAQAPPQAQPLRLPRRHPRQPLPLPPQPPRRLPRGYLAFRHPALR